MIHMLLPGTKTATSATFHHSPEHGSSDQMGETLRASDCAMSLLRTMIAKDENTFCTESHVPLRDDSDVEGTFSCTLQNKFLSGESP